MARGFVARKGGVSMSSVLKDRVLVALETLDGLLCAIALSPAMDTVDVRRLATTPGGEELLIDATEKLRHDIVVRMRTLYEALSDASKEEA
jgi:hypothetical protein